jgi:hypothetical protein
MCAQDFSVSRRTRFRWCFLDFVKDFWFRSSLCSLKISASPVELGSGNDFCICNDAVFDNNFWFCSSLSALKISASTVELGSGDDFGFAATLISSKISDSAVVYALWDFSVTRGWFMCAEDFCVSRRNRFRWWFPGLQLLTFRQGFLILQ